MRIPVITTGLIGAAALLALATPNAAAPEIGAPAPNTGATTWFNHIGADFDLASLKGQAVVLEFWATW